MTKMKFYKQARTMYIEENIQIDIISQSLNISRRTLFYWKKKYEWDKKYFEKKYNKEIFNQELLDFTKKFMNKLSKDMDNHIPFSQPEVYSFLNILKNTPISKQFKISKTKQKQQKVEDLFTPEYIKYIEKYILGIQSMQTQRRPKYGRNKITNQR